VRDAQVSIETSDEESLEVVADFLRRYDADELSARGAMFGVARCMITWASSRGVTTR
jgi:hypothetical protein